MSIFLTKKKIIKDWTDYNGHMNVAYYVLIFDQYGSEVLVTSFDMGEHSAKTTKKSTMVVESHITCLLYTSPSPRDRRLSRMPSSA